jgi:hypothetical protein
LGQNQLYVENLAMRSRWVYRRPELTLSKWRSTWHTNGGGLVKSIVPWVDDVSDKGIEVK